METATQIIETLAQLGVTVKMVGPDRLRIEPASKIPADLLPRIRESKPAILAALARPTEAVQPADCRHCEGKGECDCPACNLRRVSGPVPCSMCRWVERQIWLGTSRPETCSHCGGQGVCECISCERGKVCGICGGSGKAPWIQ